MATTTTTMTRGAPPSSSSSTLPAQPSDVALVKDILEPWVISGDTAARAYVHAADLYAADPEKLARRFLPAVSADADCAWYFLSPLRAKSPRDRRKVRAVADGAGCWHSEAAPKNVLDHLNGDRHIGYRQSFSFMRRTDGGAGKDVRTGWIMTEFHLHRYDDGLLGKKVEGLVLCKMYRSPRNNNNRLPAVPYGSGSAVEDVSDDVSFDAASSTETETFGVDDEDLDVVTERRQQWHCRSSDDGSPTVGNEVVSGSARKKMRMTVAPMDHAESSGVALAHAESSGVELALKVTAAGAPAVAAHLHCPQCGFHLAALEALATLTSIMNREDAGRRTRRRTPSCGILEQRTCTRFS